MTRRLFTLVSALSLVLCVATCVLWFRSYPSPSLMIDVAAARSVPDRATRRQAKTPDLLVQPSSE
jgi:hypothetical protein